MDPNRGNEEINYSPQQAVAAVPTPDVSIPPVEPAQGVQWQASEFINHQKNAAWFVPLAIAIILASAVIYLITRSFFSAAVIMLGGIAFMVFAQQKPRTLSYSLTNSTIRIGNKVYSYDDFRTFSILLEGGLPSIFLEPIKRFIPPLSIYFAPEDG